MALDERGLPRVAPVALLASESRPHANVEELINQLSDHVWVKRFSRQELSRMGHVSVLLEAGTRCFPRTEKPRKNLVALDTNGSTDVFVHFVAKP